MTPAPPNSKRAARDRLLVLLFLAALGAPWVDQIVRTDEARGPLQREHRLPGAQPEFALDPLALYKFPAAYESYFKDTFGLRDVLLRWHTRQSLELFDTSPTTQVLLGKDGWYFYTGNDSVRALRGLIPFSEGELESWKTGLEARRDWLRAQGIDYLFVLAPNKETVYPDFLPDSLTRIGPTRFDQLADYLKRNSDLEFLDMRAAFAAARRDDTPTSHLYLEEGTHWNARGVLVAYREILGRLARFDPALAPLPPEEWLQVPFDTSGDTWASNMYIGDLSRQREVGLMRGPIGSARSLPLNAGLEGPFGPGRKFLRGTKDDSQPRALMFHDSFGPFLENMLSENCSTLECEWTYEFDTTEVLSFRPRVVLELWVERALVFRDPHTLAPHPALTAEAAFTHAPTVLLRVDPTLPAELELLGQMKVRGASDARGPFLCLQPGNDADTLLLPALSGKSQGLPLLHVSIDSPRAGALDILYLREGETQYIRQHNCPVALQPGGNDLYLRMPDARIAGKLRLRPRFAPEGPYLLRAFEVRSGTNP